MSFGFGFGPGRHRRGAGGTPVATDDLRTGQTQMLGIYPYDGGETNLGHFSAAQTWLGAPIDRWVRFLSYGSWSSLRSDADTLPAIPARAMFSLPLTVGSGSTASTSLASVAAGSNDADFTYVAQQLVLRQAAGIIHIRLGWEMNGAYFPWYAFGNEASYIAAFQRVVGLLRAVSSRFKITWCVNNINDTAPDPVTMYPGDAYVDAIGMDCYFNNTYDNADPTTAWNYRYNGFNRGLQWAAAFAVTHGKPFAVDEWGITTDTYAPIIPLMASFLASSNAFYHGYWDASPAPTCRVSDNSKPNAATAFITAFGPPSITSSASQVAEVGTATSFAVTTKHAATLALSGASAGVTLAGSTVSIASQGSTGTLTGTLTATDSRGVTATQTFSVVVSAAVTDLYPSHYAAFDPVNGFYKIGTFKSNSLAAFLARSEVHYSSDPTAAISASGFLPTDSHSLYLELPGGTTWSIFTEQNAPVHVDGTYNGLLTLAKASEGGTYVGVVRDGYQASPRYARSGIRDGYGNIGSDTNFYPFPASGSSKIAVTTSASEVRFYAAGNLYYTAATTLLNTKPMGRHALGYDANSGKSWQALVKRVLIKNSTDNAGAAAWL